MAHEDSHKDAIKRMTFKRIATASIQKAKQLDGAVQQAVSEESNDTKYGERMIQTAAEDAMIIAGNVSLESVRHSYIQFCPPREISAAKESKIPPENPEGFLTSSEIGDGAYLDAEVQNVSRSAKEKQKTSARKRAQLKEQTIRRGALQKHLEKNDPYKAKVAKLPCAEKKRAASEGVRQIACEVWQRIKALAAKVASKVSSAAWPVLLVCTIILLAVLMFGSITAIVGSPMGILVADETNDPNSIPIATIVQEINAEFEAAIAAEIAAHPECDEVKIHYLYPDGQTWRDFWPEILALYAVDASINRGEDVVVLDAESKNRIREIFWQMHNINALVETVEVLSSSCPKPEQEEANDDEKTMEEDFDDIQEIEQNKTSQILEYRCVLHVCVFSERLDCMIEFLDFNQEQQSILYELVSVSMCANM